MLLIPIGLVIGWASISYRVIRTFRVVGQCIELTPGIGFIYISIRDSFEAFVGNKRRLNHAVIVSVTLDKLWQVGFLTDEKLSCFNLEEDYVSVCVPPAYTVAGQL